MKTKVTFLGNDACIIDTVEGSFLQHYSSIIAFIGIDGKIKLDINKWNYSTSTGKYRNQFLNEDKKITQKKIDNGEYELVNLNE